MNRTYFVIACFSMALAVTLGALGAHALKEALSGEQLLSFQTGVRYHIYHALALLVLSLNFNSSPWRRIMLIMLIGTIAFSGSIYLLSTRELLFSPDSLRFLGPVTPVGGLLLIAAWCLAGIEGLKRAK